MDVGLELKTMLADAAKRLGRNLNGNLEEVRVYAATRMLHLSGLIGQPGYQEALLAERDNVAMMAGIAGINAADAADRELIGAIGGGMALGARMLVGRR